MRFSIRDVLWLTVVVGLSMALWAEKRHAGELDRQLRSAWWHYGPGVKTGSSPEVDWSVLRLSGADKNFDYNSGW